MCVCVHTRVFSLPLHTGTSASLALPQLSELLLELWLLAETISLILSPGEPLPGPHLGQVSVHGPVTSNLGNQGYVKKKTKKNTVIASPPP